MKEKLDQLNLNGNKRIITRDTYLKLVEDSEIKNKILNCKGITTEELYGLGILTASEAVKNSVFDVISDVKKSAYEWLFSPRSHSVENSQTNFPVDMSDEEFEQNTQDIPENSPGKKAKKAQDLWDARKRGVGKKI